MEQTKDSFDYGLVSIVVPNYNYGKFIGATIASVQSQTYTNWELIVIDDGSSDDSVKAVKEKQKDDDRIVLLSTAKNSGAAKARNLGIARARGRYIAFLDADDLFLPQKLQRQVEFMKEKDAAFSFCGAELVDEQGKSLGKSFCPKDKRYTYSNILHRNEINCLSAMYDCQKLGKIYMPEDAIKREDYACFLNILKKCDGYGFSETLTQYRIHGGSISSNKLKMVPYQWHLYRRVEKLSWPHSLFLMGCWVFWSVWKHFLKR